MHLHLQQKFPFRYQSRYLVILVRQGFGLMDSLALSRLIFQQFGTIIRATSFSLYEEILRHCIVGNMARVMLDQDKRLNEIGLKLDYLKNQERDITTIDFAFYRKNASIMSFYGVGIHNFITQGAPGESYFPLMWSFLDDSMSADDMIAMLNKGAKFSFKLSH